MALRAGMVLLLALLAAIPAKTVGFGAARSIQATPTAGEPTTLTCSEIQSTILGRAVGYCVALPADYDPKGSRRYPVIYYLHGLFENQHSWGDRGGQSVLDDLIRQGQVGKVIVVCPDGGRTFYIDSFDGKVRYEDFFIQEFVPAIDAAYRTEPGRAHRAIGGDSMGGYGALHLAMRHADIFGTCAAQSAALIPEIPNPLPTEGRWAFYARILQLPFGSPLNQAYFEENNPLTLARDPAKFSKLNLYFDCGDNDRYGFDQGAKLLDSELTREGFPHEFTLRPGGHGWSYLADYMKYALVFEWNHLNQPPRAASLAQPPRGHHISAEGGTR